MGAENPALNNTPNRSVNDLRMTPETMQNQCNVQKAGKTACPRRISRDRSDGGHLGRVATRAGENVYVHANEREKNVRTIA